MQHFDCATFRHYEHLSISFFVLSIGFVTSLMGLDLQPVRAANRHAPTIDDSLPMIRAVVGAHCVASANAGLANTSPALLNLDVSGSPVSAYLIWSGRDRSNQGDNVILINEQPLMANEERKGESGGGSWWHTYVSDVQGLVAAEIPNGGELAWTISGLSIDENQGGENHGVGLIVVHSGPGCENAEINIHAGLDSFKRTAPTPIHGPHSAVHCTTVNPSAEVRQIVVQLYLGGIENAERNATIWLKTFADPTEAGGSPTPFTAPATLIEQQGALSFVDPVGNDSTQRQWDQFVTNIELPPGHTQMCIQVESIGSAGISAVLVGMIAQVHSVDATIPNAISGRVWLDANEDGLPEVSETGIPNIVVLLRDVDDRRIYQAFVTGPSGEYRFTGLLKPAYIVDVAEELFTEEWLQTSDADMVLDTETLVVLNSGIDRENINFGFASTDPKGSISGAVWLDTNGNGIRDSDTDEGIGQIAIRLLDKIGVLVVEQVTAEDGTFTFGTLPPLEYTVQISIASLPVGLIQTFEADGTLDGAVDVSLADSLSQDGIGFGFGTQGQIHGRIWRDVNGDGLQTDDEIGINNVLLLLTDPRGVGRVAVTLNDGNYNFENLPVGAYVLRVVPETIPPAAILTFDPDGVLDGITTLDVAVSTVITDANFGFDLTISGLSTSPPIDIANADIDLSDPQALWEYLLRMLGQRRSNDEDRENTELPYNSRADEQSVPNQGGDDGGSDGEINSPAQVDEEEDSVDNMEHPANSGTTFEIHLPLIR